LLWQLKITSWCCITWRELLGEAPGLLEELLEVGLAVQHTVHGRVAAHLQEANALSFGLQRQKNSCFCGLHAEIIGCK